MSLKDSGLEKDAHKGILYKKWSCPSPKAIFLLVHGLGAHSGRWDLLADFFLQKNISSYAIELKGFGETPDARGHIDSFHIYFRDILALGDIVKKENRGKKIFLAGESMGALISFLLAALEPYAFDGLIAISAAFKSRLKFNLWVHVQFLFFLLTNPKRPLEMPFDSMMCTRDLDYLKAMEIDPREHRFATPKLLLNILLAQMRANAVKNKIRIPSLFLIAGDNDQLTDPEAVQRVFSDWILRDKEIIRYPQMSHALSVDLGREKVFSDILTWVNKRI